MFAPPRFDEDPAEEPVEAAPASTVGEHVPEAAPAAAEPTDAAEDTGRADSFLSLVDVRRLWPDIVDATKVRRRVTWIHLTQNAQVIAVDATTLTLGFTNAGARESFLAGGSDEILRQAAIDVVGAEWRIDAIIDPSAQPDAGRPVVLQSSTGTVAHARSAAPAEETSAPPARAHEGTPASAAPDSPPSWAAPQADQPDASQPAQVQTAPPSGSAGPSAAREALSRSREPAADPGTPVDHRALADEAADPDDPAADTQGLDSTALLQQALGAKVVEEIKHT